MQVIVNSSITNAKRIDPSKVQVTFGCARFRVALISTYSERSDNDWQRCQQNVRIDCDILFVDDFHSIAFPEGNLVILSRVEVVKSSNDNAGY